MQAPAPGGTSSGSVCSAAGGGLARRQEDASRFLVRRCSLPSFLGRHEGRSCCRAARFGRPSGRGGSPFRLAASIGS